VEIDDRATQRHTPRAVWMILAAAAGAGLLLLFEPFLLPIAMAAVIASPPIAELSRFAGLDPDELPALAAEKN
jgi:predicted PurR-regulated permease PerM